MAATLPARPARCVLSPAAKLALIRANDCHRDGRLYLGMADAADAAVTSLLAQFDLIEKTSPEWPLRPWAVTTAGVHMRGYLEHQSRLRWLAARVREEGITGEDLADIAVDVDNGVESYMGCSAVFWHAFEAAAEQSGQSAEDLRQDLQEYLGW